MLFRSKLCDICTTTLNLAFESLKDKERDSDQIPHHITKESLIDSILHRSCHLCRLIIYHLKLHWSFKHWQDKDDDTEPPNTLTEDDFKNSDFKFSSFASDSRIVRSYMRGLPETLNLHATVSRYLAEEKGVFGLAVIDCDALNMEDVNAAMTRLWVFNKDAWGSDVVRDRMNDNTSADSCQALIKRWLGQCGRHVKCSASQQSFLPTRLLDLEHVDTDGQIKLVTSRDIVEKDPSSESSLPLSSYVTLSHCWGGDVPFQLRENTMEKMMAGFLLSEMPKTFRDAIEVARWADVRYIWIDSCCIVQGSASDWEREAKMMRQVYKHTYFNISADHSLNSHGGLFSDRLAYKFSPCPYTAPDVGEVFFLPQFDLTKPLVESALSERAWARQERFLSPRILHFTTDQLFYECAGLYACETFPLGVPKVYDNSTSWHYRSAHIRPIASQEDDNKAYEIWGQICEDYSRSQLTYLSDKLIAFAGMAGEFQTRFPNDKYLAGLWSGDLISGLLWKAMAFNGRPIQPNGSHELHADPYITATVPEKYRAPSWSWLGKDCAIFWQKLVRHSPRDMVEILEARVEYVDENDQTGDIQNGWLKIRGFLRAATWTQSGDVDSIVLDGKSGDQLLVPHEDLAAPSKADKIAIQRDTGSHFPTEKIFCLFIRMSTSKRAASLNNPVLEGLVLGATDEIDTYKRLGHFEATGEGHCRALLFELRGPAREERQPWTSLDLRPRQPNEESQTNGFVERLGLQYDTALFRQVEERVLKIV